MNKRKCWIRQWKLMEQLVTNIKWSKEIWQNINAKYSKKLKLRLVRESILFNSIKQCFQNILQMNMRGIQVNHSLEKILPKIWFIKYLLKTKNFNKITYSILWTMKNMMKTIDRVSYLEKIKLLFLEEGLMKLRIFYMF